MDANSTPGLPAEALMSATPQQMRLALIEGAIRFGEEARRAWDAGQYEVGSAGIARVRRIVAELLREIPADQSPLCRQMEGVYLFLFQSLVGIQIRRDVAELDRVLDVLREEQETWRQVCRTSVTTEGEKPNRKRAA